MAEHVYKKIEIVGSSPNGMEEAVHNALSRASKTIRNMRWFEVTETRGYIDERQNRALAGDVENRVYAGRVMFRARFACRLSDSTVSTLALQRFPVLRRSVQFGGTVNQDRGL